MAREIACRLLPRERRGRRLHRLLKLMETPGAVVNADPDHARQSAWREKAKTFRFEAERRDGPAGLPQCRRQISYAADLHVAEELQREMNLLRPRPAHGRCG